ncbi:hypothetical protein HC031_03750 [Planosporangium thailandense]|uniref:Anti sigma-E protein RseA N-terminal domain-containing protein n=1 Tax=Planosporangium thailandense TaxID=765197 RepID=A0ABX0XSG5_9ACTN|nr:hypothetical protein [Planosporangium thailandense]NJC68842.1 hypothetical protein [Planosporangium thailandense]
MTGDVDLDRLADYVGGALDGTPDEAAVARLVATDPTWSSAHAALVAADARVRADLRLLAAEAEPMPDDVLARVSAALEAEAGPGIPAPAGGHPGLSVLPGGRATRVPDGRRRRAVIGVAAAAVVGLGAISVAAQLHTSGGRGGAAVSSAGRAPAQPQSGATDLYASPDIRTSGTDYSPGELSALPTAPFSAQARQPQQQAGPDVMKDASSSPTSAATGAPDELRPLTEPAARAACLGAIMARYGGTPTMLDYARFQGRPALIVLLDGAGGVTGRKRAVAVGPHCGAGGAVTDERYSTQVG